MELNLPKLEVTTAAADIPKRKLLFPDAQSVKGALLSGERTFGTPAASLSWGIDGSVGDEVKAGMEGEKMVAKTLAELAEKYPRAYIFHSVEWPGSVGDTDHMVVMGDTLFIIDAKRWKSSRKYSVTDKGEVMRGTVRFDEGKVKMIPAMKTWRGHLPKGVRIMGVVCVAQEKVFVPYDENWKKSPYKLVTNEKLIEFMDHLIKKRELADRKPDPKVLAVIMKGVVEERNRTSEIINLNAMKRK